MTSSRCPGRATRGYGAQIVPHYHLQTLEELSGRRITWLTLRQRGKAELACSGGPARHCLETPHHRTGRPLPPPHLHEDTATLRGINAPTRQIALKNIGRDEPAPLITNDCAAPGKDQSARYAKQMLIENELDAYIGTWRITSGGVIADLTLRRPPPRPH